MHKKLSQTGLRWLWIAIFVIAIDFFTKVWVQNHLMLYGVIPVTSFFNITLAHNKGAAFSFLNNAAGWQIWLFGSIAFLVSLGILIWLYRISSKQVWLAIALSLILGGAIGNLLDRIQYGHVIDFLDFYVGQWHWPTFNMADSAVCVGALMLLIEALFFKKNKES